MKYNIECFGLELAVRTDSVGVQLKVYMFEVCVAQAVSEREGRGHRQVRDAVPSVPEWGRKVCVRHASVGRRDLDGQSPAGVDRSGQDVGDRRSACLAGKE